MRWGAFLYARHLTDVLWYGAVRLSVRTSVRPYVRPSVRTSVRSVVHNPCGQDIARTIWPRMLKLSMERRRSLFIFKVKGQISRSLRLYKEFWHLDPCGQDIARTI